MDRFILKTFAGSATNSGVFGSFKAGTPTTTTNPASIQSAAWDNGWNDAVVTLGKFPKLEEMQGVQYVISKAVKELYKEGVPVWDADEEYYQYSIVSYTPTGDTVPKLYYNLTGTYTSTNPADDTTNWAELTYKYVAGTGIDITDNVISCVLDVSGKANVNFDNVSATGKITATAWGIPDYTAGTTITVPTTGYTVAKDSYVLLSATISTGLTLILQIGSYVVDKTKSAVSGTYHVRGFIPAGSVITTYQDSTLVQTTGVIYPLKGVS